MDISIWIILTISIFALIGLAATKNEGRGHYAYSAKPKLLSPAERSFFGVLNLAVNESIQVFAKVRVADILKPQKGMNRSDWQRAFNKISGKHFDFVLCSRDDISVLCVIELNDKSHHSSKRYSRDQFLREACGSASLPLIEIPAKRSYVVEEIKHEIAKALK